MAQESFQLGVNFKYFCAKVLSLVNLPLQSDQYFFFSQQQPFYSKETTDLYFHLLFVFIQHNRLLE